MKHYNTVWITDKNPDVVEPTFKALADRELNFLIDKLSKENGVKPKMSIIGNYTMVEYGDKNKAVFFCDVE